MIFNEKSLIATLNPAVLIGAMIIIVGVARFCAKRYRDTNDFAKSSKLYAVISVPVLGGLIFMNITIILALGMIVCGFLIMALFSNHFFYN